MPVDAGSNVREDVHLEIGSATQTVEVQAEAVSLQTDNARSQTVITDKLIHDLPTVVGGNLRSPFDLAILTPESKTSKTLKFFSLNHLPKSVLHQKLLAHLVVSQNI